MSDKKLCIVVLGKPNSGKTSLWKTLIDRPLKRRIRIGWRKVELLHKLFVDAYMVPSSPQESGKTLERIFAEKLNNKLPNLLLCSVQYCVDAKRSLDYLKASGYEIVVLWLNPGYNSQPYSDMFSIEAYASNLSAKMTKCGAQNVDLIVNKKLIQSEILDWFTSNYP